MSDRPAVAVDEVSKRYRLYNERNQSLKAALLRRRRLKYEEFWALRDVSLEIAPGEPEAAEPRGRGTRGSGRRVSPTRHDPCYPPARRGERRRSAE